MHLYNSRDLKFCVAYFQQHTNQIAELVDVAVRNEEYPFPEYSSWILTHIAKWDKSVVAPFYNNLIDNILVESDNQTVLRNNLNTIHCLEISDYKESEFIDRLISFIQNGENKVALQVYSIYLLVHFIKKYPDLKIEIVPLVEMYYTDRSPAYKAAVRKFMQKIKKI